MAFLFRFMVISVCLVSKVEGCYLLWQNYQHILWFQTSLIRPLGARILALLTKIFSFLKCSILKKGSRGAVSHTYIDDMVVKRKFESEHLQHLSGMTMALNRFISRSVDRCRPFFQLLHKWKDFSWSKECDQAFHDLK